MNKKGISPLIATVLIIGFTIVLAVLVITWISGTVNDQTESTDCMVGLQNQCLQSVGALSVAQVGAAQNANVNIVNEGSVVYNTGKLVLLDSTGASLALVDKVVTAYGTFTFTAAEATAAATDGSFPRASITQVRFIPAISGTGDCSATTAECDPVEASVSYS